ncbi:MAG: PHP domain-containing protein [Promethearchaeota archaeon]
MHSHFSDGLDSPSQLIEKALASKHDIKAIALTDHDSIEGVKEFLDYGEDKDIIVLPGVEISIKDDPKREIKDVHVIGLNIDYSSSKLNNELKLQLKGRIKQKEKICKRLRDELGFKIRFQEVQKSAGGNSIGRPHIVDILIKNNSEKVKNYTKDKLFEMISVGGIAHFPRDFELTIEEAAESIKSAGGVPILAHPGIYEVQDRSLFVAMCVDAGIKGIEIEYTYDKNRPFLGTEKASWAKKFFPELFGKIAIKYDLIKSGGSDYHGGKKNIFIGDAGVPDAYLKRLI